MKADGGQTGWMWSHQLLRKFHVSWSFLFSLHDLLFISLSQRFHCPPERRRSPLVLPKRLQRMSDNSADVLLCARSWRTQMNLQDLVRASVKTKERGMSSTSGGIHVCEAGTSYPPPSPPSFSPSYPQVVMSQRLGSSLRRKVGETETQLLALHEAKLAAISGNSHFHPNASLQH